MKKLLILITFGLFEDKLKVTNLQERSKDILNVFTKTSEELQIVNNHVQVAKTQKLEEIKKLNQEVSDLDVITVGNTKIIQKVEEFLK